MSVARFIADQRTSHRAARGAHGAPRLLDDLRDAGWTVSRKSVAESMRRQRLVARQVRKHRGMTRQDRKAPKFPDPLKRDFHATSPNEKWVGDMTEIVTREGKFYVATIIGRGHLPPLCGGGGPRKLLAAATSRHPDADLACQAVKMAVAARGGRSAIEGVIFHSDRGSTGVYGYQLHPPVPQQVRHPPIDGSNRVVFRQRSSRIVLLRHGMRSPLQIPLRHHRRGPRNWAGLVLPLLQRHPPTLQCRWDATQPIRISQPAIGSRITTLHDSGATPLIFVALTATLTACGGQGDVTISNENPKDVTVSPPDDEFTVSGYGATVLLDSGCIQGDVTVEFASGRTAVVPGPICPEKQIMIQHGKAKLQPAETEPSDP